MSRSPKPIHPGAILHGELMGPLGLDAKAVALALKVPAARVSAILRGRGKVDPEMALRLARHFGTSAEFWLSLQARYDLELARAKLGRAIDRAVKPRPKPMGLPRSGG